MFWLLKKLRDIIDYFDMFKEKPKLNVAGKEEIGTIFTKIISMLIIGGLIGCALFLGKPIIDK